MLLIWAAGFKHPKTYDLWSSALQTEPYLLATGLQFFLFGLDSNPQPYNQSSSALLTMLLVLALNNST